MTLLVKPAQVLLLIVLDVNQVNICSKEHAKTVVLLVFHVMDHISIIVYHVRPVNICNFI